MRSLRPTSLTLSAVLLFGVVGCTEQSGVKEETTVIGPEGSTTITKDTKIKTSGDHPPSVAIPGSEKEPSTTPNP